MRGQMHLAAVSSAQAAMPAHARSMTCMWLNGWHVMLATRAWTWLAPCTHARTHGMQTCVCACVCRLEDCSLCGQTGLFVPYSKGSATQLYLERCTLTGTKQVRREAGRP